MATLPRTIPTLAMAKLTRLMISEMGKELKTAMKLPSLMKTSAERTL